MVGKDRESGKRAKERRKEGCDERSEMVGGIGDRKGEK